MTSISGLLVDWLIVALELSKSYVLMVPGCEGLRVARLARIYWLSWQLKMG